MSIEKKTTEEQQIADFLGVRVLTPLEEDMVDLSGGTGIDQHDHDGAEHHDHVYHTTPGHNTQ